MQKIYLLLLLVISFMTNAARRVPIFYDNNGITLRVRNINDVDIQDFIQYMYTVIAQIGQVSVSNREKLANFMIQFNRLSALLINENNNLQETMDKELQCPIGSDAKCICKN